MLPNGQHIPVKRLSQRSCQGSNESKRKTLYFVPNFTKTRFLGFALMDGDERWII